MNGNSSPWCTLRGVGVAGRREACGCTGLGVVRWGVGSGGFLFGWGVGRYSGGRESLGFSARGTGSANEGSGEVVRECDRARVLQGALHGGAEVGCRIHTREPGGLQEGVEERRDLCAQPGAGAVVVLPADHDAARGARSAWSLSSGTRGSRRKTSRPCRSLNRYARALPMVVRSGMPPFFSWARRKISATTSRERSRRILSRSASTRSPSGDPASSGTRGRVRSMLYTTSPLGMGSRVAPHFSQVLSSSGSLRTATGTRAPEASRASRSTHRPTAELPTPNSRAASRRSGQTRDAAWRMPPPAGEALPDTASAADPRAPPPSPAPARTPRSKARPSYPKTAPAPTQPQDVPRRGVTTGWGQRSSGSC